MPSSNVQFLTLKYYSGYVVKILDFISYLTPQLATHSFVFPLSSYKKHNTYTFMYINIGSLLSSTALKKRMKRGVRFKDACHKKRNKNALNEYIYFFYDSSQMCVMRSQCTMYDVTLV